MSVQDRRFVTLDCHELRQFMVNMLVAAGVSKVGAEAAADVHLDADMKGMGVQGFDYLPYTLNSLKRGLIDPTDHWCGLGLQSLSHHRESGPRLSGAANSTTRLAAPPGTKATLPD